MLRCSAAPHRKPGGNSLCLPGGVAHLGIEHVSAQGPPGPNQHDCSNMFHTVLLCFPLVSLVLVRFSNLDPRTETFRFFFFLVSRASRGIEDKQGAGMTETSPAVGLSFQALAKSRSESLSQGAQLKGQWVPPPMHTLQLFVSCSDSGQPNLQILH